jgi:hypothetical protein
MPYQSGPLLAALGSGDKLAAAPTPLDRIRQRRMENKASALEERKVKAEEERIQYEIAAAKREEKKQEELVAKRQKVVSTLPPKPAPGSPPEALSAWYVQAADHALQGGFPKMAETFSELGAKAHAQQVVSPWDIQETQANIGYIEEQSYTEQENQPLRRAQTENELAAAELKRVQAASGGFAPSAATKPPTTKQLLEQDETIRENFDYIFNNEITGLEFGGIGEDDEGALRTPVSIDNREYLRDMYSEAVQQDGPDGARTLIRNGVTVIERGKGWESGPHEAIVVPKAWLQYYSTEFAKIHNRPPTKDEQVEAFKMVIASWKRDTGNQ